MMLMKLLMRLVILVILKVSNFFDGHALFISALSQSTGDVQNLYHVQNRSGSIDVYHLTQLIGNYLDIDNWSFENFII